MNRRLRKNSCALLLLVLASSASIASANDTAVPQHIPDAYAQAAKLVTIGQGRQLNLRCSGSGTHTVLLEAGSHADSMSWFRVQPLLAPLSRVCAYDRAGYGFSSEGPLPRNLDADVTDLHALIASAKIDTPLILVGHSLGSNIARRYAERYPADVDGMVLLDPPAQDIAAFAPAWAKDDDKLNVQRFAFIRQCETAARTGALASPPPELKSCLARANPLAGAKLNAQIVANKSKPAYWRSLLSELQDNAEVFNQPVPAHETHGSIPLLVLTASNTYADAPADVRRLLEAARDKTQAQIVASSSRGERQFVADSSHDIELDQPDVVAHAVTKVLQQTASH